MTMSEKTLNIITKINLFLEETSTDSNIESTGVNLIESSINLLNLISEYYDDDMAKELTNRFVNSIKNKDSAKFQRKIREVKNGSE